ncbi:MAG: hypothetical protein HKN03_12530 [Acidimicrobiales bacterium]|nr:hypothetical protein [Acidimicrobiales bacterium]
MAEFDRSEHKRPDAVVDAEYEDFDDSNDRHRRRVAMAIGGPLFALILAMVVLVAIQARDGRNEDVTGPVALQVELRAREAPLLIPQDDQMIARLQELRVEQEVFTAVEGTQVRSLNQADLAPGVRAIPAGDPWFLGPGLLWLLFPILVITLIPVLRRQRWDPS